MDTKIETRAVTEARCPCCFTWVIVDVERGVIKDHARMSVTSGPGYLNFYENRVPCPGAGLRVR